MSKGNGAAGAEHPTLIEGFKILDEHLIERNAPKIQWGRGYKEMSTDDKIRHLEKLASTMNHAAFLIQNERNQLIEVCELKEKQLKSMSESVERNNNMLQTEIIKMNEQKQIYNKEIARLNQIIREFERGDNN